MFRFPLSPLETPHPHRLKEGHIPSLDSPLPAVQPIRRFVYRTPALKSCAAASQQLCYSAAQTNRFGGSLSRGPAGAFARDGSAFGLHIIEGLLLLLTCRTSQYLKPGIPKGLAPGAVFGDFLQKQKVTRPEAELSPPEADTSQRADTASPAVIDGNGTCSGERNNSSRRNEKCPQRTISQIKEDIPCTSTNT